MGGQLTPAGRLRAPSPTPWRARIGHGTGNGLLALPLGFLLIGFVIPVGMVMARAIGDLGLVGTFDATVGDETFRRVVGRTLVLATTVTFITAVLGLVYALALGLASRAVRAFLVFALFASFWISLLVRTYGWVILLQPEGALDKALSALGLRDEPLGWYQTTAGMYPAMVHIMLPFATLPSLAAVASLDDRQLAAAQSMGARPSLTIRRVVLPALASGVVAGAVLVFVLSLSFYVTPAFLGSASDLVIATAIDVQFSRLFEFSTAAAMGAMLLFWVLALYVLADRVFRISERWGGAA